jgi:multimeric flavodoxin WrbA
MGTTATLDTLNKYFLHGEMPVAASRYWNAVHGNSPEEVMKDEEGLQTMRVLGRNMAVPSTMLSTSRCLPSYPCHPC